MAHGVVDTHIRRTPDEVFAVIADVSKNVRWSSSAVAGKMTSHGPVGVGSTAYEVSRFLGRKIEVESVLTEFVPGTFEATPTGLFGLVAPLFATLIRRKFERDLGNLKRLMNAREL